MSWEDFLDKHPKEIAQIIELIVQYAGTTDADGEIFKVAARMINRIVLSAEKVNKKQLSRCGSVLDKLKMLGIKDKQ